MLLEGAERSRLTLKAEGLVPVVQMGSGEDDEKTGVVPRAEESTVVQWAGAADKSMGAVQGLEPELRPCFPSFTYRASSFDSNWRAHAHNFTYVHLRACV